MGRYLPAAVAALLLLSSESVAQSTFGNALTLTGDTSYVDVGNHENHDFPPDVDFMITCWFKTPSAATQRLVYRFDIATVNGFALFVNFGRIVGTIWTPGVFSVEDPPTFGPGDLYNDNEWHHVAFGKQGSEIGMLIDGEKIVSREGAPAASLVNAASLTIGADAVPDNLFFFEGQIDEVRIWNKALTIDQIRATMFDTLGPEYYATPDSGLVAYYRFDEIEDLGAGSPGENDVRDFSVYARHGDLVGSPTIEPTAEDDFSRPRLTLIFQEMGAPHFGEKFEVRVTDQEDGREVGRHTVDSIDRNDIEVWLNTILVGHSYTIDFYADHNKNGTYDAPPADHAWRLTLEPAVGNDTVTFVHNINFTDIGWPPLIDFAFYEAIWKGIVANSDGSTFDLTVTTRSDAVNGALDGMLEARNVLGIFDLLQIYYSGSLSSTGESATASVVDGSSGKGALNDWSGMLQYTNNGLVSSNIAYNAMGLTADFSLEGTIGRTQGILTYHSEMLDIDGTILVREDSVLSKSLVAVDSDELPDRSNYLGQNYPNPFRPVTHIPFTLPETGAVEIAVFDLLGRRVATLFSGFRPAGDHTIAFEGSSFGTGVYTYRMTARLPSGRRIDESKRLAIIR